MSGMQKRIEKKLTESLNPSYLEVVNESHMHNVPPGSESHFKVTVVTTEFENKLLVARHRVLNQLLKEELEGEVHALSLNTLTPTEWLKKNGEVRNSPPCLGGKAKQDNS